MNAGLFLLQRGTAIILLPLVLLHIGLIIFAVQDGLSSEEILSRTRGSIFWALLYGIFVVSAAIHAAIGLRTVLSEWLSPRPAVLRLVAVGYLFLLLVLGLRAVYAVVAV